MVLDGIPDDNRCHRAFVCKTGGFGNLLLANPKGTEKKLLELGLY